MSLIIYGEGSNPSLPEFEFYEGKEKLRFDQSKWKYYRVLSDGSVEPMCGVTTVCHIIDKSQPLMAWAVKKALAKLKKLLLEHGICSDLFIELPEEELDKYIAEAKKADKEELEAAAETGHVAHDWIEQYIKAILADNEARRHELLAKLPVDERAANACIAAVEWMSAHDVRWIATERKVFSRKYGYAGTMDGLALVSSCTNPSCCPKQFTDRCSIVDWKTSNYLYIEYVLQTAAYQQAFQEEMYEHFPIEDRWINRLGKDDAEFDPWHIEGEELFNDDLHAFLQALGLYKSVHSIQDRVDAVKDAKKAAQKEVERLTKEAAMKIRCPKADTYKGTRMSKCLEDGSQCAACKLIYETRKVSSIRDSNAG